MSDRNIKPNVSIGMPVFNGEKYIKEAIDSLLAQTFDDFELVISDNASTDGTSAICEQYAKKDSRIIYFRQNVNLGAAKNFSFVLKEATGKYFMWAASDDVWHSNWLEKLHGLIIKKTTIATFGQVVPINQNSVAIKHIAIGLKYNFSGLRFIRRLSFYLNDESTGKANLFYSLYQTELLKHVNIENYRYDYSLIYDLLSVAEYESVEGVFLYKRDHIEAAGNLPQIKKNKAQWVLRQVFPLSKDLFKEYLILSVWYEKIFIVLCLPIKFLFAYKARFKTLFL